MLKAGLISCWNEKQNTKSYLSANKHSGLDFTLSLHTNLPGANCCFVGCSVSMRQKILEYEKDRLQYIWQKGGLVKLLYQGC